MKNLEFESFDRGGASLERIKELSMKKIKSAHRRSRKPVKIVLIAAVLIAALGITALAVADTWGFTDTSGMNRWEINRLLKEYNIASFTQLVDAQGNVSYMDGGEVLFTLSAEEALAYDEALREERRQKVRESTDKLDVDSMELFPNSVTEIAVDGEGCFGDFILNNGNTVLLCASDGGSFSLKKGDAVSLSICSGEKSIIHYGLVHDGKMLEEVPLRGAELCHSFTIPSDGEYYFTLSYYSAGADNFTDGKIVIG